MTNLYTGCSLISLNKKYKVRCYWFCVDRKHRILPCQELISGYYPNQKGIERGVNELFTEQEIKSLEDYLASKKIELEIKKVDIFPFNDDYVGLRDSPQGGGAGFIKLSEHEGYSLPFNVWGYYDYKDSEDLVSYSEDEVETKLKEQGRVIITHKDNLIFNRF